MKVFGKMYAYNIEAKGRYVRLLFEDGAHAHAGQKLVELVEVQVIDGAPKNDSKGK